MPLPLAKSSASLIDLQPRVSRLEALQGVQNADLALLRKRTASIIQRWYMVDVLRAGESWAEFERRIEVIEQKLRRAARAKSDGQ